MLHLIFVMKIWHLIFHLTIFSVLKNSFCSSLKFSPSWKPFVLTKVSLPRSMQKWHLLGVLKTEKVRCFITGFKSKVIPISKPMLHLIFVLKIWHLILHLTIFSVSRYSFAFRSRKHLVHSNPNWFVTWLYKSWFLIGIRVGRKIITYTQPFYWQKHILLTYLIKWVCILNEHYLEIRN
jgi:hypothetical protein